MYVYVCVEGGCVVFMTSRKNQIEKAKEKKESMSDNLYLHKKSTISITICQLTKKREKRKEKSIKNNNYVPDALK